MVKRERHVVNGKVPQHAPFHFLLVSSKILASHFHSSCFVLPFCWFSHVDLRLRLFLSRSQLFPFVLWCVFSHCHTPTISVCPNFSGSTLNTLSAITSFDPVSDSTPAAVVTEIDEDSAFSEARDNLRALLSQGKRHSVEINASSSVGEEWHPRCAGANAAVMCMEDEIGDMAETQAQEPGSKRHKEGDVAKDLLDQLRHDAWMRDQRMAERMAEHDAAGMLQW